MAKKKANSQTQSIDLKELGRLLFEKRKADKLTLEQASQQIGVSAPTLSRLEKQAKDDKLRFTPDTRTLSALLDWLKIPAEHFWFSGHEATQEEINLPDFVDQHLRAKKNLDPKTAKTISDMFRLAYEQLVASDESKDNREK